MNEHKQPWTNTFEEVIDQITKLPKHTEGPWSVDGSGDGILHLHNDEDGNYTRIAKIENWLFCHNYEVAQANARLISAAPDLLDALKLVCTMYERTTGLPAPSQAQRAIAKAEGGAV